MQKPGDPPAPVAARAFAAGRLSWSAWFRAFLPGPLGIDRRERLRVVLGVLLGILVTAGLSHALPGLSWFPSLPGIWLMAPLGASAVLVFAAPASPLAQPWSVAGGNALSALIGLACSLWIPNVVLAAGAAVALAVAGMMALRCLHPPGGAMALLAVLLHATGWEFAAIALVNSLLLVLVGLVYNPRTGRRYPHAQVPTPSAPQPPAARFRSEDLDAVLARYNQVLDVSRDDLQALLQEAELEGYRRSVGAIRCRDVMSPKVICVAPESSLHQAWGLMRARGVKALPVVDDARRIVGIITMADFLRAVAIYGEGTLLSRLRSLLLARRSGTENDERPVGAIMTTNASTIGQERPIVELLPLFAESGHHHIPVVDELGRVVGIITESDFVRALYPQGSGAMVAPS